LPISSSESSDVSGDRHEVKPRRDGCSIPRSVESESCTGIVGGASDGGSRYSNVNFGSDSVEREEERYGRRRGGKSQRTKHSTRRVPQQLSPRKFSSKRLKEAMRKETETHESPKPSMSE